jgi:transposase
MKRQQKYQVSLSDEERRELGRLVRSGRGSARAIRRAQILLKADEGWSDPRIAEAYGVATGTVHDVRRQCVEEGAAATLARKPGNRPRRALDGAGEAHLIALTCSEPPAGRERWTLRLLAGRMVALGYVDAISHETVRQALKKTSSSRG